MIRPKLVLFIAGLLCGSIAEADDKSKPKSDDPVADALTVAKDEYTSAVEKAGEKLAAAFAEQQKKLEANTKLKVDVQIKQIEQIQSEQKEFEADPSKLPKSTYMRDAVREYQSKLATARKKCESGFDKAAEAYRGKKDLASAKVVLGEKEQFFQGTVESIMLTKGMIWKGVKTWTKVGAVRPSGSKQEYEMEIAEVVKGDFKGVVRFKGSNPIPIKGTVKGKLVVWTGDGANLEEYKATMEGNTLKGECGNGTFVLSLFKAEAK